MNPMSWPAEGSQDGPRKFWGGKLLACGLGLFALVWLLDSIHWQEALDALAGVPVMVWAISVAGLLASHLCRGSRLHREWSSRVQMRWIDACRLSIQHSAWVVLAPLRAGEGAYLWILRREYGVSLREASVSLLRLRVQDVLALLVMAIGAFGPGPLPGRILLMVSLAVLFILGLPRLSSWFSAPAASWFWTFANWAVKLAAVGWFLAAFVQLDAETAWAASLGGEMAGALPLQPPAGIGPYEAGIVFGAKWHADLPWQHLAAGGLAIHLLMLAVTVLSAVVTSLLPKSRGLQRAEIGKGDTATHPLLEPAQATPPLALPEHRLSVVVPMFNERENATQQVDDVVHALMDYPAPWELIVVDDGSTDGTPALLRVHLGTIGAHVRLLELSRNFRQTAAMQAGIDAARGDVIVTMDGDRQNDPRDIPKLVARLLKEDLDLVAGWRQHRQDSMLVRKLPSRIANQLIRNVSGLQFQDLGCSLKAFRASVLKQVRLYGEMHRFIPAWLATVTSPGRMAEEPVNHHPRRAGNSKYGLSRTFRVMVDLLAMFYFLRFGTRPGHFFGGIGLVFGTLGLSLLSYLLILKALGESIGGRPLLWLGFFLVLAGVQLLTTGVLAEILMRTYVDRTATRSYHIRHESPLAGDDHGWRTLSR